MTEAVKALMDQLFEGAPDTEELRGLREEITDNCEEHFQDLTARGLDESEASEEIASSLRGMEEVVASLSHQVCPPAEESPESVSVAAGPPEDPDQPAGDQPATDQPGDLSFPAEGLTGLKIIANSDDLELGISDDQLLHVRWDPSSGVEVHSLQEGEVLTLSVEHHLNTEGETESVQQAFSCDLEKGSISINFKDLFGRVKGLLRSGLQALEPVSVRVLVPAGALASLDVSSRSGDVSAEGCGFRTVRISSVSGDVTCRDSAVLDELYCSTTSGDLYTDVFAEAMTLSTLSGDIGVRGGAVTAEIRSTSGDIELQGGLARANVITVSGDLDIALHSRLHLESLRLRSTSGDVELHLDEGCQASFSLSTVSGDVENSRESIPGGAGIQINTVSGDIDVD